MYLCFPMMVGTRTVLCLLLSYSVTTTALKCHEFANRCLSEIPKDPIDSLFTTDDAIYVHRLCRWLPSYTKCISDTNFLSNCKPFLFNVKNLGFSLKDLERSAGLVCQSHTDYTALRECFVKASKTIKICRAQKIKDVISVIMSRESGVLCGVHLAYIQCVGDGVRNVSSVSTKCPAAAAYMSIIVRASLQPHCQYYSFESNVRSLLVAADTIIAKQSGQSIAHQAMVKCCGILSVDVYDVFSIVLPRNGVDIINRCRRATRFKMCLNAENMTPTLEKTDRLTNALDELCGISLMYEKSTGYYNDMFEYVWARCNRKIVSNLQDLYKSSSISTTQTRQRIKDVYGICLINGITDVSCKTTLCERLLKYIRSTLSPTTTTITTTAQSTQSTIQPRAVSVAVSYNVISLCITNIIAIDFIRISAI